MDGFEKSMYVLKELFGQDYQFALATSEIARLFPFETDIIFIE